MTPVEVALALALVCAFIVGTAVNRGSTCAVAAARDLVDSRRIDTMVGFVIAVGVAALMTVGGKWLFGSWVHMVGDPGVGQAVLIGGILLGIGATVNGACLFGTLGRIGNGELRFIGMPIGLAAGFFLIAMQHNVGPSTPMPNRLASPSWAGLLVMAGFLAMATIAWRRLAAKPLPAQRSWWSYRGAMALLGLFGGIEFMLIPGSTYVDAVRLSVLGGMAGYAVPLTATAAALAGTLVAGLSAGTFRLRAPTLALFSRSLVGGALMAAGGWLIPGGNDALLLAYLPAATLGGLFAYLVMTVTVIALITARRHLAKGIYGGRGKD